MWEGRNRGPREHTYDAPHPLQAITEVRKLSPGAEAALDAIVASFDERAAARVKEIEAATNHDVKAVEYFLKEAFDGAFAAGRRGRDGRWRGWGTVATRS